MPTYSFLDVNASIMGPGAAFSLGGNGSGTAQEGITITRNEDKNQMTIGADGGGMHSLRANRSGVITVRLLKTSPVNGLLQAAFDLQRISSANWGQNTLVISDTARGEVTSGLFAAFKQFTPVTYAQDGNVMEWPFDCIMIETVLAGLITNG